MNRARPGLSGLLLAAAALAACGDGTGPAARQPALVFDWLRGGNREIYAAGADGSDTVRLSQDPGDDEYPTAAGEVVVFTSYRDGNGELYSVPVTGGAQRRLTTSPANETDAALSPDGSRLAFVSDESGTPKLWMSAADGSGAAPLTTNFGFPGSPEVSPAWAPAGDRLAFVSTVNGSADIFVLVPGSTPTPLVTGPSADVEPAWSPDGGRIAFASDRDGDTELYVLTIGGEPSRLTRRAGIDAQPAWLDDRTLAYAAWVDGTPRLRVMDATGAGEGRDLIAGGNGPAQHAAAIFSRR